MDRDTPRLWRADHRPGGCRRGIAVRAAQHDPAAVADCLLRPGEPARHMVCADGLADEPGAGGGSVADQVPQPDLCGAARRLRGPGPLLVGVALIGLLLPVAAIAIFGRRI